MTLPTKVTLVEVGPRDGLQNEKTPIATATKIKLIKQLQAAGLTRIEATSFVAKNKIPQLADAREVITGLDLTDPNCQISALVPNTQGLDAALDCGVKEIAVFTSVSDTFNQKNIGCSIDESLTRIEAVTRKAKPLGLRIRGYISCIAACPYEGNKAPGLTAKLTRQLFDLGCDEVSLGDTIGVATPNTIEAIINAVAKAHSLDTIALHCHNTYGQALANIFHALTLGVHIIDSSVAGLGGCPYAKGATGNVATEDVVYLLHGLGIETGIDLNQLITCGKWISHELGRTVQACVTNAS